MTTKNKIVKIFILLLAFNCITYCKSLRKLNISKIKDVFHHKIIWKKADIPKINRDPVLNEYVTSFVNDAREYGVNLTDGVVDKLRIMKYVDKLSVAAGEGVVAACNRYYVESISQEGLKIYEEQKKWLSIEILKRESEEYTQGKEPKLKELVYHELFHCLLNKGHLPPGYDGEEVTWWADCKWKAGQCDRYEDHKKQINNK